MPFNSYADPWKIINSSPAPKGPGTIAEGARPNPCNYIWDKATYLILAGAPSFSVGKDMLGFEEPGRTDFKKILPKTVADIQKKLHIKDYTKRIDL